MCGRYSSDLPPELLARVFGTVNELPNFPANYNLAPTQLAPVVRRHPGRGRAASRPLALGFPAVLDEGAEAGAQADQRQGRDGRHYGDVPGRLRPAPLSGARRGVL